MGERNGCIHHQAQLCDILVPTNAILEPIADAVQICISKLHAFAADLQCIEVVGRDDELWAAVVVEGNGKEDFGHLVVTIKLSFSSSDFLRNKSSNSSHTKVTQIQPVAKS